MTLGGAAAAGVRLILIVWCRGGHHQVEPDPTELAGRYGAETRVLEWRFRNAARPTRTNTTNSSSGTAGRSLAQTRFKIGYLRAAAVLMRSPRCREVLREMTTIFEPSCFWFL